MLCFPEYVELIPPKVFFCTVNREFYFSKSIAFDTENVLHLRKVSGNFFVVNKSSFLLYRPLLQAFFPVGSMVENMLDHLVPWGFDINKR